MAANSFEDDGEPEALSEGMSRRTLLRRSGTAAAGVAAAGAGAHRIDLDPVQEADALLPAAAGLAIGVGAYMTLKQESHDTKAVKGVIQFEDHLESYNRFREWWEVENEVQLASFENDLNTLHDQLLNNGIRTLYEQALEGSDEASAISTAKEDMDADADEIAEWIISWWNARCGSDAMTTLHENGNVYSTSTYEEQQYNTRSDPVTDETYNLPGSGNQVSVSGVDFTDGGVAVPLLIAEDGELAKYEENGLSETAYAIEPDPENYSFDTDEYDGPEDFDEWEHVDGDQPGINATQYRDLIAKIEDKLATAKSDLDAVASDHFTAIQEGDVSLDELMAPGGLLETAAEADTAHGAALFFRAQNMPHTGGVKIEADNPDTGETVTLEGYLGWSVAEDGDTIPVGASIDPESYLGSIYFATQYENDDGEMVGDVIEFVEPFTIVSSNEEGDSVTFESPDSLPDADTDPGETIDIFQENRDTEQDARDMTIEIVEEETSNDGGIGFPDFGGSSLPSWVSWPLILIAVGVAAAYKALTGD